MDRISILLLESLMPRNTYSSARRLLTLARWLEQGQAITYRRICEAFGVKRAQARDDLRLLRGFYELERLREGREASFRRSYRSDAPRVLARAAAVEFGSAAADILECTVYEEAAREVLAELRHRVFPPHIPRLDALAAAFHHRRTSRSTHGPRAGIIEDLLTALEFGFGVNIVHHRLYDDKRRVYDLAPAALVLYRDALQLVARKHPSGALRVFDLDGIICSEVLRQLRFEPPPTLDVEGLYEHAFGRYVDFPSHRVELLVCGYPASELKRRSVHPTQQTAEKTEGMYVTLDVGLCPDLVTWVLGLIPDVTVLGPPELAEEVEGRVRGFLSSS